MWADIPLSVLVPYRGITFCVSSAWEMMFQLTRSLDSYIGRPGYAKNDETAM